MTVKRYFFLGIGGIGNSALALYFKSAGYLVSGYDRVQSPLTKQLEQKGIFIVYEKRSELLPVWVSPETTKIIASAAIDVNQELYRYFESAGFVIEKRAKTLATIANAQICVAVAGTHGKTSTLSYLTHIFATAEAAFTAFVGGVIRTYETNFITKGSQYILVEADEFDRSFLQLYPHYAAITNIDPDHLDIYESRTAFQQAFETFAGQVKNPIIKGSTMPVAGISLIQGEASAYGYDNLRMEGTGYLVDLSLNATRLQDVFVAAIGAHNLHNALIAAALADQIGLSKSAIISALGSFPGIHRRMAVTNLSGGRVMIDDYAHHPTEIEAVFASLEERFPTAHKTVIFQPHLYSRTRDFMEAFAQSLSKFDAVYLLPIYAARETPIRGVTSAVLLAMIDKASKSLLEKEAVVDTVVQMKTGVVAVLGAGDIGLLPKKIIEKV